MSYNIDSLLFIGFLIFNLVFGLYVSRNIKNIKEYAIGNRNFSTATIAATIAATWMSGGGFFNNLYETYNNGFYNILIEIADASCILMVGIFLAPRLAEFLGKLSIAEAMGDLYGKQVRIITAIAGLVGISGFIAAQLKVAGWLFSNSLGIDEIYGSLIGCTIITIYSASGGIKSVTLTDVIQLFAFGTIIPTIALFIYGTINDLESIKVTLKSNTLFNFKEIFDFSQPKSFEYLLLFSFAIIPESNPAIFQRIAMAKNVAQVRKSFLIAGFVCLFLALTMTSIGVIVLSVYPGEDPSKIFQYVLFNHSYIGLKGLTLIGIMAMVMSTADSYINSSAILFVHDLCGPLKINVTKNPLLSSRIFSMLIGIFSLFLALSGDNLLNLFNATSSFYLPIVTVPYLLTILGFRSSGKSVLIGMGAGFITVILMIVFDFNAIQRMIPGMLANLIFLIGSHYLLKQPGGWVGIKDDSYLNHLRKERNRKIQVILQKIRNFNLIDFFVSNTPKQSNIYVYFGIYCIVSIFSIIFSLSQETRNLHAELFDFIVPSILILATILGSYPLWYYRIPTYKTLIAIIWNISIFYVLICVGSLLIMISNFASLQLMLFMINLIILAIVSRWQTALFMTIGGIVITSYFYKFYTQIHFEEIANNLTSLEFKMSYLLLLFSAVLIAFFKPKQEHEVATEYKVESLKTKVIKYREENVNLNEKVDFIHERLNDQYKENERLGATAQRILNNVNHELRLPIGNVINFSDMLIDAVEKLDKKLLKEFAKEIFDNSNRISTMILNMLDLAALNAKKIELEKANINFSELVMDRVNQCRKIYLKDKKIDFQLTIEPELMVAVDPNYIRQTVDNLIINSINFSKEGIIKINVRKENKHVKFEIADQGIGIPPAELADIFTPFKMGSNTESKAHGRGVGLALCKAAVEIHGGMISASSNGTDGASFLFILPA